MSPGVCVFCTVSLGLCYSNCLAHVCVVDSVEAVSNDPTSLVLADNAEVLANNAEAATWKQVLEYNNSHIQDSADSTVVNVSSLPVVSTPDNPLNGSLTESTRKSRAEDCELPLMASVVTKSVSEQIQATFEQRQKCMSAGDLIDMPTDEPTAKLSMSADQLDSSERKRSTLMSRLEQLILDESDEQVSVPVRRGSFAGMMQLAKSAMSSRYRGLRNSLKATSAEWLNAGGDAMNAIQKASSNTALNSKSCT